MATRLKTTEWHVPLKATLTDNTLEAFTPIKLYIPEFSGAVTFKSCQVTASVKCGAAMAIANFNERTLTVSVGGAGATTYTNGIAMTSSGEDIMVWLAADCTAHFQTNWTTGTSQIFALQILVDSAAAAPAMKDCEATLYITYEYDDTQATQIKTAYIPLNAPVGAFGSSKPGSPYDTIPALDTELPETSKVIRNMFIVMEGNGGLTSTDSTVSLQVDSYTAYTSASIERSANSDQYERFIYGLKYYDLAGAAQNIYTDTSATHGLYLWSSTTGSHVHQQVYMVVTYEFDATANTDVYVSMILPMTKQDIMGGPTDADYTRGDVTFWIEEANIVPKRIAAYLFWEQIGAISTLQFRCGTGSFVTYTDTPATLCGSNACMVRKDDAITMARGRNILSTDSYRSDLTDLGWGLNGYFIVSYTGDKPTAGYGAANHTVKLGCGQANYCWDGSLSASGAERAISAWAPSIPETNYFLNNFGININLWATGVALTNLVMMMENTTSESGMDWLKIFMSYNPSDPETGLHILYNNLTDWFKRYPSDPHIADALRSTGLDVETARRYWLRVFGPQEFDKWNWLLSYHTISFTVAGTISGSAGGAIAIEVWDTVLKRKIESTNRIGDGAYSVTVYDSANDLTVEAYEDGTHMGRAATGKAS